MSLANSKCNDLLLHSKDLKIAYIKNINTQPKQLIAIASSAADQPLFIRSNAQAALFSFQKMLTSQSAVHFHCSRSKHCSGCSCFNLQFHSPSLTHCHCDHGSTLRPVKVYMKIFRITNDKKTRKGTANEYTSKKKKT